MLERDVEKYLCTRVEAEGGEVRKLKWIGRDGAPDRLVMLRGPWFVEMKAPGKKLEPHQSREHDRMAQHEITVWTLDSKTAVDEFLFWVLQ